jgi:recombinational DNA repair protein (RecF pathway)
MNATPERCAGCTTVLGAVRHYRADGGRVCGNCYEQARAKVYPCHACGRNFSSLDYADPISARDRHETGCNEHPRSIR